ncbi:hypothetical protein [Fulvivirga ligni]|uniref:hypothetical protein n=1 Tax=Fulvivirga ligni TaxID=2904246 RepID=UPI001F40A1BC|nr:hypothetical protein [Fulvivirga ligni]UII23601.1 hypothetical protein LVD16_10215 [Fulvivirga ligni]
MHTEKGNLIHVGGVEDVTKGAELVEVRSESADLKQVMAKFEGLAKLVEEENQVVVTLKDGASAGQLNKFLFENGIVATHLVTQRKSLEKQFLELLAESDHA